jgi:Ca2+-binding RTX toxin-like protein
VFQFPKQATLVAVAAAGALAAPTAAGAAVTSSVSGDTLTVSGDQAGDTITLAAANRVITVNGQPTALTAGNQANIVVDAGDGADTIDASGLAQTDYLALGVKGGGGDDLITGGAGNDDLNGEGGNDRLIGFQGADQVAGGDGNDVLVWNNGDGTDVMDGDAGVDEVEINGAPTAGDAFTAVPLILEGRVKFSRTNLGQFFINFSAERLTVNGLGGDDTFTGAPGLAPLTLLSVDGGTGNDTLTGGDGNDVLTGGDGSDVLDGQEGDDTLLARDGQGDVVRGGAGVDSAQTDALTVDAVDGVEAIDATPPPAVVPPPVAPPQVVPPPVVPPPVVDTRAFLPTLGHVAVVRSHGHLVARVPLSCSAVETGGCQTTVTFTTGATVLGSGGLHLRGGRRTTLSVRLTGRAARLARHGRLSTRVRIATRDAAGNRASRRVTLRLRIPH